MSRKINVYNCILNKNISIKVDKEDFEKIKNSKLIIINNIVYIEDISIPLSKQILCLKECEEVIFLNKNIFDYRKSNLFINKDLVHNKYEIRKNGIVEVILTDYYDFEKARTIIDISDLEKVINYKFKWHYTIIKGNPCIYSKDENGNKIYLEQFLLNSNLYVKHLNNNSLDNRKSNLLELPKLNKNKKDKNKINSSNNSQVFRNRHYTYFEEEEDFNFDF